jgi:methylmalonyl-CoA epimerase
VKAILDHVGIAVADLEEALGFFRDALGLEVETAVDVPSQRVKALFVPTGPASLELLEPTSSDSAIAKFLERRGPGLHHITLRVDDIRAALEQLRHRKVRLVDPAPRAGAEGSLVAFIHPSSAHGVLVELKEAQPMSRPADAHPVAIDGGTEGNRRAQLLLRQKTPRTIAIGAIEIVILSDGLFRLDGGAMFGVVPKTFWEKKSPPDDRNRIQMSMNPLLVRGARTMLVDAGCGDKMTAKQADIYAFEREFNLQHSLAAAGASPDSIDIVLATHLHFDHAGGFTSRGADDVVRPRFPRAQYVIRRGEFEDAMNPNERTKGSYFQENYQPLAEAGVLQLLNDDATIMPGVRVRRTGGHTMHHQMVVIESGGKTAVFVADLLPTAAHLPEVWVMGYDLFPLDTLAFKRDFIREAIEREYLILFEHDPEIAAGYIREKSDGKRYVEPVA